MRRLLLRFRNNTSGLTLVESAFIMMILLSIMVTGLEVLRYYRLARHLKTGAESFADLLGQRRVPLRGSNWSEDASALAWLVPDVRADLGDDWRQRIGVQTTYARFVPDDPSCKNKCSSSYARILWTWDGGLAASKSLLTDAGYLRDCSMRLVPGGDVASKALPVEFFSGEDILIVTLGFRFRPRALSSLFTEKLLVMQTYVATPKDRLLIDPAGFANEVAACP